MQESFKAEAEALFADALRIKSFTPTDTDCGPYAPAANREILELFSRHATGSGAHLTRILAFEGDDDQYPQRIENLLIRWRTSYGKRIPRSLCVIAHCDVVGNLTGWTVDPFGAEVKDGKIFGRGAVDMKGSVVAFLMAMKKLWSTRTYNEVNMIITSDEEWAAVNGTRKVLAWMKEHLIRSDAFLILEPCNVKTLGDTTPIGRRGSLRGAVEIQGISGHPANETSIANPYRTAGKVVEALYGIEYQPDADWFYARTNLEVLDIVRGGGDKNATATSATVTWNIRYTGNYTAPQLAEMVRNAVMEYNTPEMPVKATANLAYASVPYLGNPGEGLEILQSVLTEKFGTAASLTQMGGTDDGRFVQEHYGKAEVVGFGLLTDLMHKPDEHAALEDFHNLIDVYAGFVERYCNYDITEEKQHLNERGLV